MSWKLFQLAIGTSVVCSNIYYGWTPNPYLAGAIGVGMSLAATHVLTSIFDLWRRFRGWQRRTAAKQQREHSFPFAGGR